MMEFIFGLIIGIIGGVVIGKFIFRNSDLNVEEAISLLKSKGYWVRINVDPNGGGE